MSDDNRIKLKPVMKTIEVIDEGKNPGFKLFDKLYWDNKVIPLNRQPRYMIGEVVGFWHRGCIVKFEDQISLFYTYSYLADVSSILREEKNVSN